MGCRKTDRTDQTDGTDFWFPVASEERTEIRGDGRQLLVPAWAAGRRAGSMSSVEEKLRQIVMLDAVTREIDPIQGKYDLVILIRDRLERGEFAFACRCVRHEV